MAGDRLSRGEDDRNKKKRSSPCPSSTYAGARSESSHQSPATAPIHQKRPIGPGSMSGSKLSNGGDDSRSMKKQKPTPIPRPRFSLAASPLHPPVLSQIEGNGRSCFPTAVTKVHDDGRIFHHDFCKICIRPSAPSKIQSLPQENEVLHGPDAAVGVLGRAAAGETQHGVSFSAEETLKNWKDLRANKVIQQIHFPSLIGLMYLKF